MEISISLASKLGSIAVHAEEYLESCPSGTKRDHRGNVMDQIAIESLLNDPEVKAFLFENKALMPVKR